MSIINGALAHYRLFGMTGIGAIARARLSRAPMEVSIASPRHLHPVLLRLRTSDVSLYEEIIVNSEYEFDAPHEPTVIVDAGANIGLTAVYFANRYPKATIVAMEPEAGNFAMLVRNTRGYKNIVPLEAALWRADRPLNLSDPGSGTWGFQTEESAEIAAGTVRGMRLDTLMRETGLDHIDILKVDIEGSEKEVFESCDGWIGDVDVLVVEFHDRFKDGCSETVQRAAVDFRTQWTRGETTFFFRSAIQPASAGRRPAAAPIAHQSQTSAGPRIVSLDAHPRSGVA